MARILEPRTQERITIVRPGRRRWKWFALAAALLTLAVLAVTTALFIQNRPKVVAKQPPVLTVAVQSAREVPLSVHLSLTGSVSAIDPLTIGAQATGLQIVSVPVEEGTFVRRGQVLASLDSSVLRAQLEAARARLVGSQATSQKALQPNRPEELTAMAQAVSQARSDMAQREAMVAQAKATLLNANDTARRYRTLFAQGAVSQQDMENQVIASRTASAAVDAAKANLQSAQHALEQTQQRAQMGMSGGRREDIVVAQATAAENAATVHQLQTQIEQTIIRAPDDGLVTKRDAHIGDITSPGKTLFEMVRKGQLELRAQISERDLPRVKVGNTATVTSGSYNATGTVWQISPTVDPTTRLGIARISIPMQSGFKPGMFANANVLSSVQPAVMVPDSAVLSDGLATHVFVYDNGIVRKRVVTTGEKANGTTQILTGVRLGESVVISGAGFLNDGDPVRLGS